MLLVAAISTPAQEVTFSPEEEGMVYYLTSMWESPVYMQSTSDYRQAVDSCYAFLNVYPQSFAVPNVLAFLLEMVSVIDSRPGRILGLADSVLVTDPHPATKLRVGKLLYDKGIDKQRGIELIRQSIKDLTIPSNIHLASLILAEHAMAEHDMRNARAWLDRALAQHPTSYAAWNLYRRVLLQMDKVREANAVMHKINNLENRDLRVYGYEPSLSPNLFRNVDEIVLETVEGEDAALKERIGPLTVLILFHPGCRASREEANVLYGLSQKYKSITFLYIAQLADAESVNPEELTGSREFPFLTETNLLIDHGVLEQQLIIRGVPTTLFIDSNHRIRYDRVGFPPNAVNDIIQGIEHLSKESVAEQR